MPRRGIPSYRLHKASGRAVVTLNGRDIYLGRYDTPESREKYDAVIRRWLDAGRVWNEREPFDNAKPSDFTVAQLILRYWEFAEDYYRKNDEPLPELYALRGALRPVRRLYGHRPARTFGPLALKAVREEFLKAGLVRKSINTQVARVRRMFAWAVENELLEGNQLHALRAVPGLRFGRCNAREGKKVRPVADEHVDAVLPHLPPAVAAMVQLQRMTAMRSGELTILRPCDIDRSQEPWRYTPASHKTECHGHRRTVLLGPRARALLASLLVGKRPEQYVFSPSASEECRNARRKLARKSKITPSQAARRRKRHRQRPWRDRYDSNSYRRAIERACEKAGVPRWTPHRLRHAAATEIRRVDGLETARTVLGHSCVDVTEVYAERDLARAAHIVEAIG